MATPTAKDIVSKADLAVANLISDGGYLQPEQANTFLDMIYDEPTMLKQSRFVKMGSYEMILPKIGFNERILHAGTPEGVALAAASRVKPSTSQITLTTKKYMGEVHISYDVLEDSIEKDQLENTIMAHMATQMALDIEEMFILGDTTSTDPFLALQDGIIARCSTNVQTLSSPNNVMSDDVLTAAYKGLPAKYRRVQKNLKFFVPDADYINYRSFLAQRGTVLGDAMIQGTAPLYSNGVVLEPAAMLTNARSILLADPRNFLWGVQRDILIETDKDIRSQIYTIVVSMRVAIQIEDEAGVVLVTGLAE